MDRSSAIEAAPSENELNEAMADSAPQQQVTNGWVARDLLTVIAEQQNELGTRPAPQDHRVPAMLGVLVLGLALALGTTSGAVRS